MREDREHVGPSSDLPELRPHAVLLVLSRGGIVDEQALADAIRDYGQGGNVTLDEALFKLYWDGIITKDTALKYSRDPEDIRKLTSDTLTRKNRPVDKP